jgi:hypothetical protein
MLSSQFSTRSVVPWVKALAKKASLIAFVWLGWITSGIGVLPKQTAPPVMLKYGAAYRGVSALGLAFSSRAKTFKERRYAMNTRGGWAKT